MVRPLIASLLLACSSNNFEIAVSDSAVPADATADATSETAEPADSNPPDVPPMLASICEGQARAVCGRYYECAPFESQRLYRDLPDCIAHHLRVCLSNRELPGVTRPVETLSACSMELAKTPCAEFLAARYPAPCRTHPGSLTGGESCRSDEQCASGFCVGGTAEQCGTCATDAIKDGTPCAASKCPFPLSCVSGTCRASHIEGESCGVSPCSATTYCSGGICVKRPANGEPCADGSKPCNYYAGDYCDAANRCRAFSLADSKAICGAVASGTAICRALGFCRTGALPTGTCIASADLEQACSNTNGPYCRAGLICAASKCQLPVTCGPTD